MYKVITQPPGGPEKGQGAGQGTLFITQKAPKNSWTHLEQASGLKLSIPRWQAAELSLANES